MRDWSLEIGTYPGILIGIRNYEVNENEGDVVLYLPFIMLIYSWIKLE